MTPQRVLIVDDHHDIRLLLRSSLELLQLDLSIVDVPSGEEAMLVISRQKFDLLVTDVRLAGMTGLELVGKVRQRNPELKVILITGLTGIEIRQKVVEFGAERYFFKPVDIADFQKAVVDCLGLASVQLPEPATIRAEPADKALVLPDLLSDLRRDLGAECIWIVDRKGSVLIRLGELPDQWQGPGNQATLSAAGAASVDVSRAMGMDLPLNYLYFGLPGFDLHMVILGQLHCLLAAIPRQPDGPQPESMHRMLQAAVEVIDPLSEYLQTISADDLAETAEAGESDSQMSDEGELVQFDAVIEEAASQQVDLKDLNEFWEALADQETDTSLESDSLSYEQARKLGLTPED